MNNQPMQINLDHYDWLPTWVAIDQ